LKRIFWSVLAGVALACGGGDLYAPCDEPEQCSDLVPEDATAECVDKEGGGFCTWSCTEDAGCDGDQDDDWDFVCSPFESNPGMYCFPACNEDGEDDLDECPPGYGCRSTGGGADNRKICFPE
jgi:hypothetical protein